MRDPIDREDALEAVSSEPLYKTGMERRYADEAVPAIYEKIKALQPAQPEIIRCKECKHYPVGGDQYEHTLKFPDEMCPCHCEDKWYSWRPGDNWFCANGERKEE